MTSEIKINSNKENAKKSTGPKDTSRTRYNALKHGITSKMVIIKGMESAEEFNILRTSIFDNFKPNSIVEELIVDKIVSDFWKLRRLQNYETYSIQYNVDDTRERVIRIDNISILPNPKSYENISKLYNEIVSDFEAAKNGYVDDEYLEKYKEEGEKVARKEYIKSLKFSKDIFETVFRKKEAEIDEKTKREKPLNMILGTDDLDKVSRYETTLQRSIKHNLDLLKEVRGFGFVSQNENSGDKNA